MKLRIKRTQLVGIIILVILLFIYAVNASDNNLPGMQLSGSNECNVCHGPSHKGHVSYTTTLNTPEVLINDTTTTVSIVVTNNDFPLSSSSLTLTSSPDYSLVAGEPAKHDLGTLSRASTTTEEWNVIIHVSTAKNVLISFDFSGTAIDHKTYTYTKTISKSIFVSTTPTAILKVVSTPPSGSTFYVNDKIQGTLQVSNVGNLGMDNVTITTIGSITVDGKSQITIPVLNPQDILNYSIRVDTTKITDNQIIVTANSQTDQQSVISISIQDKPPLPISVVIGRIIGYVAYTLLFLSVVTGVAKYPLRKWFSGRKLRILHADLSNLAFTMVIIHAISLTIPNSPWAQSYQWFQVLPTGIPTELTQVGLELGRWGMVIMYISILSGYYFSTLIKRFGRKIGIRVHMLSYIALIAGVFHAISIGGTASNPIITLLLLLSLGSVFYLKFDAMRRKTAKRDRRQVRMELARAPADVRKPAVKSTKKTVQVAVDVRTGKSRSMGIVCWNCLTLNDDDANYCKSCSKTLIGQICTHCQTRNDPDAKFCKKCGGKEFIQLNRSFKHG